MQHSEYRHPGFAAKAYARLPRHAHHFIDADLLAVLRAADPSLMPQARRDALAEVLVWTGQSELLPDRSLPELEELLEIMESAFRLQHVVPPGPKGGRPVRLNAQARSAVRSRRAPGALWADAFPDGYIPADLGRGMLVRWLQYRVNALGRALQDEPVTLSWDKLLEQGDDTTDDALEDMGASGVAVDLDGDLVHLSRPASQPWFAIRGLLRGMHDPNKAATDVVPGHLKPLPLTDREYYLMQTCLPLPKSYRYGDITKFSKSGTRAPTTRRSLPMAVRHEAQYDIDPTTPGLTLDDLALPPDPTEELATKQWVIGELADLERQIARLIHGPSWEPPDFEGWPE